jgi:hypothetical protein
MINSLYIRIMKTWDDPFFPYNIFIWQNKGGEKYNDLNPPPLPSQREFDELIQPAGKPRWEKREINSYNLPFATLSENDARELMDNLWEAGIRPSKDISSSGEIGAVREHLKDMRKLVSKALKVEL